MPGYVRVRFGRKRQRFPAGVRFDCFECRGAVDRVRLRFLRSGGCLCYPPGRSGEFLAEGEECVLVAVHDIAAVGHHRFVLKYGDEHGAGSLAVVLDGEVRGE